jgi:hypothetical protein
MLLVQSGTGIFLEFGLDIFYFVVVKSFIVTAQAVAPAYTT